MMACVSVTVIGAAGGRSGVGVGFGVGLGVGFGVGLGVGVGAFVGVGVAVGAFVGVAVAAGAFVAVGVGVGLGDTPTPATLAGTDDAPGPPGDPGAGLAEDELQPATISAATTMLRRPVLHMTADPPRTC